MVPFTRAVKHGQWILFTIVPTPMCYKCTAFVLYLYRVCTTLAPGPVPMHHKCRTNVAQNSTIHSPYQCTTNIYLRYISISVLHLDCIDTSILHALFWTVEYTKWCHFKGAKLPICNSDISSACSYNILTEYRHVSRLFYPLCRKPPHPPLPLPPRDSLVLHPCLSNARSTFVGKGNSDSALQI